MCMLYVCELYDGSRSHMSGKFFINLQHSNRVTEGTTILIIVYDDNYKILCYKCMELHICLKLTEFKICLSFILKHKTTFL